MTESDETRCPKCGIALKDSDFGDCIWLCGTDMINGQIIQSPNCRIRELERDNDILRNMLIVDSHWQEADLERVMQERRP